MDRMDMVTSKTSKETRDIREAKKISRDKKKHTACGQITTEVRTNCLTSLLKTLDQTIYSQSPFGDPLRETRNV